MRAGFSIVIAITVGLGGCQDDGSCGGSIEAYCGGGTACPMTWTAAQDPNAWRGKADTCTEETDAVQLFTCSDVLVAYIKHIDTGETYYFDRTSGDLYRVDGDELIQHQTKCLVGSGPVLTCDAPPVMLCVSP